jgi:hypothetical protein
MPARKPKRRPAAVAAKKLAATRPQAHLRSGQLAGALPAPYLARRPASPTGVTDGRLVPVTSAAGSDGDTLPATAQRRGENRQCSTFSKAADRGRP